MQTGVASEWFLCMLTEQLSGWVVASAHCAKGTGKRRSVCTPAYPRPFRR